MKSFSYWEAKYFWQPSDVVVIGGGITGLTTSIFLKKMKPDWRIVLLERGALPSGASTKNAGFACFGSMSEIMDDLKHHAEREVFDLIAKRAEGLAMLRELLGDEQLGYEACGGFEVFLEGEDERYKDCLAALSYVNYQLADVLGSQPFRDSSQGIPATGMKGVRHMLVNAAEGLIETGKMMYHLCQLARATGVEIYTGVEVLSIDQGPEGQIIHTAQARLQANRVCVATNGFAARLLPELDVQACRAQVLLTAPIPQLKLHGAFHHHYGYNYFRHIHGRVLLGGGRHLHKAAEQTDVMDTTHEVQHYLEGLLREHLLPGQPVEIDMRWSGIMGMGSSKEVIVKEVRHGLCCAVRFGGMGVALGTAAGHEAARLVVAQ